MNPGSLRGASIVGRITADMRTGNNVHHGPEKHPL
jgi:hypothetical protein